MRHLGCLYQRPVPPRKIQADTLTIHADDGAAIIAKPLAAMLEAMGVAKSHSRPYVSNDNPFIESHFRIFKYWPTFPKNSAF
jgi:putative transposase